MFVLLWHTKHDTFPSTPSAPSEPSSPLVPAGPIGPSFVHDAAMSVQKKPKTNNLKKEFSLIIFKN
jgi:hypothetical protein